MNMCAGASEVAGKQPATTPGGLRGGMPSCEHCASDILAHVTSGARPDGAVAWVCQGHWHTLAASGTRERCAPRPSQPVLSLRTPSLPARGSPYVVNPRWKY